MRVFQLVVEVIVVLAITGQVYSREVAALSYAESEISSFTWTVENFSEHMLPYVSPMVSFQPEEPLAPLFYAVLRMDVNMEYHFVFAVATPKEGPEVKCVFNLFLLNPETGNVEYSMLDLDNQMPVSTFAYYGSDEMSYHFSGRQIRVYYNELKATTIRNDTVIMKIQVKSVVKSVNRELSFRIPVDSLSDGGIKLIDMDIKLSNAGFSAADGIVIPVPRTLLSMESAKIEQLFSEAASVSCPFPDVLISVSNHNSAIINKVLQLIYSMDTLVADDEAEGVLNFADEFDLKRVKAIAEQKIGARVTVDNALKMMDIADQYNANQLRLYIIKHLQSQSSYMVTDKWQTIMESLLPRIRNHTSTIE